MKAYKYETKDYKEHPPGFIITKTTMDVLLKRNKSESLIALYVFYGYVSCWQNTRRVKATTSYVAKGLGWSTRKVQRVKKELIDLGLVKDVVTRDSNGAITGHYIHPLYFTTPAVLSGVEEMTDKCLYTNSNKCSITNSRNSASCSRHNGVDKFDRIASTKLHDIILTQKNINLNTTHWPNTFRLLRTRDKVSKARIKKAIEWYGEHIGGDYVPVAHSAKSFREKFVRIEDAINRSNGKKQNKGPIYKQGANGEWGYYEV